LASSLPLPALRQAARIRSLLALLALWLAVAALPAQAAVAPLSPADRVALRAEIVDLLANEPNLPLPVRQRSEGLAAYYGDGARPILWLGQARADDLVAWLRNAAEDGLDPSAYPADQLAKLMAAASETNSRGRAIIELHYSAAFLQYASDLQVGRFLPRKVDPDFFQEGRAIDQVAALDGVGAAPDLDRFFLSWQPQAPEYADLRAALADYRALAQRRWLAGGASRRIAQARDDRPARPRAPRPPSR
jgi:murein L,D-transpeptidase YcbB/YkuD